VYVLFHGLYVLPPKVPSFPGFYKGLFPWSPATSCAVVVAVLSVVWCCCSLCCVSWQNDEQEPVGWSRGNAQSTEHRAQSTEHRAQSTEHRAQSTEHRAQSAERRAQSAERRAQSTERRAESTEHRAQRENRAAQLDPLPSTVDRRVWRHSCPTSTHSGSSDGSTGKERGSWTLGLSDSRTLYSLHRTHGHGLDGSTLPPPPPPARAAARLPLRSTAM
jgi:hypothetical protein